MASSEEKPGGHILIILTGGNIGLIATIEKTETLLLVASPDDIRKMVFNNEDSRTVLLREGSLAGKPIQVDIHDLRDTTTRRFKDPEEFDSAQVNPELWARIAEKIKSQYDKYEGFVVLHGLDTMAYTASALSFMLRNLQKPVVFTGSQRPLNFARTDALQNIFSAITMAASESLGLMKAIPEVTVYSYDTLFRANRSSMVSASSYRTFDSPNFPPLATVGEHIEIQSHLIKSKEQARVLNAELKVEAKVAILDVFPGMDARIIHALTRTQAEESEEVKGVLLRTYGMGTAPTSEKVLKALDGLYKEEIVVMNVTQARSGRISHGQDPVSLRLFEQGVVSGVDMTAEAAYAKMVVLLSQVDDFRRVSDQLQIARAGEQSQSIFHIHFSANATREDPEGGDSFITVLEPARDVEDAPLLRNNLNRVSYIQLRLLGLEPVNRPPEDRGSRTIELDVMLVDPDREHTHEVAHLKNDYLKWFAKGRTTINKAYDITDHKDKLLSRDRIPSTYVKLRTNEPIKWKHASIAVFTGVDESG